MFFSPYLSTASAVPRILGSHMSGSARLKGSVCCRLRLSGVLAGPEVSFPFQPELAPLNGVIRHGEGVGALSDNPVTVLLPWIRQSLKQQLTTQKEREVGSPRVPFPAAPPHSSGSPWETVFICQLSSF